MEQDYIPCSPTGKKKPINVAVPVDARMDTSLSSLRAISYGHSMNVAGSSESRLPFPFN